MTWTDQEDDLLRQAYPDESRTVDEVVRLLGKSHTEITRRRAKLGIPARSGPTNRTPWPDHLVAELTRLWLEGVLTATEIGDRLGKSKNAVVGKALRERLASKKDGVNRGYVPPETLPDRTRSTRHSCAWPVGHPGDKDFHFCGCPVVPEKPYCAAHCAVAYVPYKLPPRAELNNLENLR